MRVLVTLWFNVNSWFGEISSARGEAARRPVRSGLQPEREELTPHHLHPHPQGFVFLQALSQMQAERRRALREQLTDFRYRRSYQHVHDGQKLRLQILAAWRHVCRHISLCCRRKLRWTKKVQRNRWVSLQRQQQHNVPLLGWRCYGCYRKS